MKVFVKQILLVFCCGFIFYLANINTANAQNNNYIFHFDTTKINKLKIAAKGIHNENPEKGLLILDTLCSYYKYQKNDNEYYIYKIQMAHCYNAIQRNYQAISIYNDVTPYFQKNKDSLRLFNIYTGIGNVYYSLKDYRKSAEFQFLAVKICNEIKYPKNKILAYCNYAATLYKFQKYDTIKIYYDKALKVVSKINDTNEVFKLQTNYAYLNLLQKKYDKAIELSLPCINHFKLVSDNHFLMRLYEIVGLSYLYLKNFDISKKYIDSTFYLNTQFNSLSNFYDIYEDYFKLDSSRGDFKSASFWLKKMIQVNDSLYEENKLNLTKDFLVKYETDKKQLENKILEEENELKQKTILKQRILLITTIILSLILLVILFIYLKFRAKQQKKILEKQQINLELKALKAQLDPHFVQNIFQLINNQIYSNPNLVSHFLHSSSIYLRSVLQASETTTQSLEDEIIFTEKYLQFQKSIFGEDFLYSIQVDDNVDTYGIFMPSMIIQPFVENTIKHSKKPNNESLKLNLIIYQQNDQLIIKIIDNGLHIEKLVKENDYQSFGNVIIKKRLELYYSKSLKKPHFKSEKISDNHGYLVELFLPVYI